MEAPPKVIVLAIGTAEECAEVEKFGAAQRGRGPAIAYRCSVLRADPIDFHRVELGQPFITKQGKRGDIVKREAQISEQDSAAQFTGHVLHRLRQYPFGLFVHIAERTGLRQCIEHQTGLVQGSRRQCRKLVPQIAPVLAIEIQRQTPIDPVPRRLQPIVGEIRIGIPLAREATGDQSQTTDPKGDVVVPQETYSSFAGPTFWVAQIAKAALQDLVSQCPGYGRSIWPVLERCGSHDEIGNPLDDPGQLRLRIGMKRIACLFGRFLLSTRTPFRKARRRRLVEKERAPENTLHGCFDFGSQRLHHAPQFHRFSRLCRQSLQVVADGLRPGDGG